MATILILIGGHFATAPRPQKEAAAAKAAGFLVLVRGVWWDHRLAAEDMELAQSIGVDFAPAVDLRPGQSGRNRLRLKQRLARELLARTGLVTPRAYGTGGPELLREALRIKPDLVMVHSEAGLWVGKQLLEKGFKVGVDFEDWFSQDMRAEDRSARPVVAIQRLERYLIHHAHTTLATTRVMAEAMAQDAGCSRVPVVIPNCFPWQAAPEPGKAPQDMRDPSALSLYWFSQTIGPGRGLETLAAALIGLRGNWQVHLRGELRNHKVWFESTFPFSLRARVFIQPTVSNRELAAHSASHDVGLALEEVFTRNRNVAAGNKIFEYLRCGLAVVATTTLGQLEVMDSCPEAGWVVAPNDCEALRDCLQSVLDHPERLQAAKVKAREAGAGAWAWENYAPRLMQTLQLAVEEQIHMP